MTIINPENFNENMYEFKLKQNLIQIMNIPFGVNKIFTRLFYLLYRIFMNNIFESRTSIRDRIFTTEDFLRHVSLDYRDLIIEIAAGSNPYSGISASKQSNTQFIAFDIARPSNKKLRNYLDSEVNDNFYYVYGNDYVEVIKQLKNIKQVIILFPIPIADTMKWLTEVLVEMLKINSNIAISIATELQPIDNDYSNYKLKYNFIDELKRILSIFEVKFQFEEKTFGEFHNEFSKTETSITLERDLMVARRGVGVFKIN